VRYGLSSETTREPGLDLLEVVHLKSFSLRDQRYAIDPVDIVLKETVGITLVGRAGMFCHSFLED
jgi:hypothetical protein